MWNVARIPPWLVIALSAALTSAAAATTPVPTKLSAEDQKAMAELALKWAADGGLQDVKLMKDPSTLVVANTGLPAKVVLEVPDHKVVVAPLVRIQAMADSRGDFLYFRFGRFTGTPQRASLSISLVWMVSEQSRTPYLSGGGATLDFEKRDGKWELLPVSNHWMS